MGDNNKITEQRPYRGMQKFSEEHKNLFFGRTKPIDEIFDLLKNNRLTVIFGRSGIGKSSLLNAGLLPKLRENFYLPVLIRIPFSDPKTDPLAYTKSEIEREMKKYVSKDFKYTEGKTLWEFFREADLARSVVIPVLIFDQFEEYFNFGKQYKERAEKFLKELSDLIENRMPDELKTGDVKKIAGSVDAQNNARIIISLREDCLAPLEDLGKLIPSLNKIRYRILPLHGKEALDAVYLPAKNFIDKDTAVYILIKMIPKKLKTEVGKETIDDADERNWEEKDFEPYIISLFCYQVNEKRIAANLNKITNELIDTTNVETILSDYYDSSLKKHQRVYHKNIAQILQNTLLSKEGYRLLKPKNASEFKDLSDDLIKDLVDDRIIQVVNRNDINNIEISHDLLANVIFEKKTESKRNKTFSIIAGSGIAVVLIMLSLIIFHQSKKASALEVRLKQDSIIKKSLTTKNISLATKNDSIDSINKRYDRTVTAITQSYSGTIYFQVSGPWKNQPQLLRCMDQLRDMKFVVPTAEVISNKPFNNIIKYFHREDEQVAMTIQSVCQKYYTNAPVQLISKDSDKVTRGTIEVWVKYEHHYDQLFSPDPTSRENAKRYLSETYKTVDAGKQWPKQLVATARKNASNETGIKNTLYVFSKMDADYLQDDKELIVSWLHEVQQTNNPEYTSLINEILDKLNAR